ncbi:hypothetical protein DH20_14475 [Pantoea agglomerans]|nr:hypothetical protein [Pantoea agglomerans]
MNSTASVSSCAAANRVSHKAGQGVEKVYQRAYKPVKHNGSEQPGYAVHGRQHTGIAQVGAYRPDKPPVQKYRENNVKNQAAQRIFRR